MTRPSRSCTIGSGEDPTIVASGCRRKYMYGDGFTSRNTRYTENGSTGSTRSKRCASTTWKMSPSRMCSFAASTAVAHSVELEVAAQLGQLGEVVAGRERGQVRQRPAELVDGAVEPLTCVVVQPRRAPDRRRRAAGTRSRSGSTAAGSDRTPRPDRRARAPRRRRPRSSGGTFGRRSISRTVS